MSFCTKNSQFSTKTVKIVPHMMLFLLTVKIKLNKLFSVFSGSKYSGNFPTSSHFSERGTLTIASKLWFHVGKMTTEPIHLQMSPLTNITIPFLLKIHDVAAFQGDLSQIL